MDTLSTLVKAAQGGNLEAFEKIVGRFQDMAYASAYSMLNDAQLAEELMHNLISKHNGYVICLSMGESTYKVGELMDLIREGELEDKVVMIFEHVQLASQVREILRHYTDLETLERQELSDANTQSLRRAQRIQKFFTQPFFVAEAYTDIPGEYVKVEETVRGFKELLAGRYDDLPEQAFYFVGGIDEAVAKGNTSLL